ncbi:DUF1501 domain-containing protein [Thalassoglobus polymorphus]|uniref:DUF1501 domain-containing protein n=1 Tax=Thalassoglobus polymorphus TaxID=2527994 RepID=A0A517QTW6_9PLAN|nr:DUF1501 domain-containing protein [Thalassoglobus polymorphus]QDT35052.1 hypothetical protein Mal48_43260 [Thalassoglobus polymorphus]
MIHHHSFRNLFQRLTRRQVMQAGLGAGVSFLLPTLSARATQKRGQERPKSLIVLWMAGGPSQVDSWDPHPASAVGETVGKIKTRLPGLEISELLPQMAEQMQNVSLVRSMVSKEGDHERGTYYAQTGYLPDPSVVHPAMTAIISKHLADPSIEIPQHISLASGDGFVVPRGGFLGAEYDAFRIFDPGRNVRNMKPNVDEKRQQRRLEGLDVVSNAFRQQRPFQTSETLHQELVNKALTMMSSKQLEAFSLDDEPKATIQKYGDSRFGRGCLVARRLVEQGVRATQVVLQGFDTHINNLKGQTKQFQILDPAFAALISDLKDRDLLDSTIVLCMGEFGRTPRLNPLEGRDHWPMGFSCVLGGGGIRSGVVIGETDPEAAKEEDKRVTERTPPKNPVSIPDLYATILTVMGLDPYEEVQSPIGRPFMLSEGSAVEQLLPEHLI